MASEIKVDTIVNAGGDNDSGIDLATNDNIKFNIAGSQKAMIDSSGNMLVGTSNANPTGADVVGASIDASGEGNFSVDGAEALRLNRKSSNGTILNLAETAQALVL